MDCRVSPACGRAWLCPAGAHFAPGSRWAEPRSRRVPHTAWKDLVPVQVLDNPVHHHGQQAGSCSEEQTHSRFLWHDGPLPPWQSGARKLPMPRVAETSPRRPGAGAGRGCRAGRCWSGGPGGRRRVPAQHLLPVGAAGGHDAVGLQFDFPSPPVYAHIVGGSGSGSPAPARPTCPTCTPSPAASTSTSSRTAALTLPYHNGRTEGVNNDEVLGAHRKDEYWTVVSKHGGRSGFECVFTPLF